MFIYYLNTSCILMNFGCPLPKRSFLSLLVRVACRGSSHLLITRELLKIKRLSHKFPISEERIPKFFWLFTCVDVMMSEQADDCQNWTCIKFSFSLWSFLFFCQMSNCPGGGSRLCHMLCVTTQDAPCGSPLWPQPRHGGCDTTQHMLR